MNKYIFFIVAFILAAQISFAQLSHVSGIKGIEINYATTLKASAVSVGVSKFISDKIYLKAEVMYDWGENKDWSKKYSSIGVDALGGYTLLDFSGKIYINGIAGVSVSANSVKNAEVYGTTEGNLYPQIGPMVGTEIETYFTPNTAFLLGADARYMVLNKFGGLRAYVKAGIKFTF